MEGNGLSREPFSSNRYFLFFQFVFYENLVSPSFINSSFTYFLVAQGNTETTDIRSDKEDADVLILQEAATEAERREARECGDIYELFGDSEAEEEAEANTRTPRLVRTVLVETSDSELEKQPKPKRATLTRKSTRSQTSQSSKAVSALNTSNVVVSVTGRQKRTSSSNCILP